MLSSVANAPGFDVFSSPEKQADPCAQRFCVYCPSVSAHQSVKVEGVSLKLLLLSGNLFFHLSLIFSRNKSLDGRRGYRRMTAEGLAWGPEVKLMNAELSLKQPEWRTGKKSVNTEEEISGRDPSLLPTFCHNQSIY